MAIKYLKPYCESDMNKGKKTVGIVITFFTRADQKSKMKSNRKKQIKDRKYIFDWAAVEWFPNEEVRPFNVNEEENTELWRKQLTRFDLVRDAAREGKGVDAKIKTLLKSMETYFEEEVELSFDAFVQFISIYDPQKQPKENEKEKKVEMKLETVEKYYSKDVNWLIEFIDKASDELSKGPKNSDKLSLKNRIEEIKANLKKLLKVIVFLPFCTSVILFYCI